MEIIDSLPGWRNSTALKRSVNLLRASARRHRPGFREDARPIERRAEPAARSRQTGPWTMVEPGMTLLARSNEDKIPRLRRASVDETKKEGGGKRFGCGSRWGTTEEKDASCWWSSPAMRLALNSRSV